MKRSGRRIFVTGATGLLGAWVARKCLEEGADVVVVLVRDRVPESLFYAETPDFRLHEKTVQVRGDLEDFSVLERTLNEYQIDEVFHLGAQTQVVLAQQSPIGTFRANIEGTWNLLEAVRIHQSRIKSVVVASSDKAYGSLAERRPYLETDALKGLHPYDVSKSCTDLLAQSYALSYGLPVVVSRCGNLFGPGDLNPQRLIPSVISSARLQKNPVLRSDGTLIREYLYVEDAAEASLQLSDYKYTGKIEDGEAFNFSYQKPMSVLEVGRLILNEMGRPDLSLDIQGKAPHEIPFQALDSTKARETLGWKPRIGFDLGLKRTIDYLRIDG